MVASKRILVEVRTVIILNNMGQYCSLTIKVGRIKKEILNSV